MANDWINKFDHIRKGGNLCFPPTGLIKVLHWEDGHALALTRTHHNAQSKHPGQDDEVNVAGFIIREAKKKEDCVGIARRSLRFTKSWSWCQFGKQRGIF